MESQHRSQRLNVALGAKGFTFSLLPAPHISLAMSLEKAVILEESGRSTAKGRLDGRVLLVNGDRTRRNTVGWQRLLKVSRG